jgi:hypothetical chaperone protein
MADTAAACGIDFGTSNSTAARMQEGQPVLMPLEDGRVTLPSVVFFHAEDSHVSYGRAALADYLAGHEGRLMRSLKSLLGTSMIDEYTEVAGRPLAFRTLLAQFIGELKKRAERSAGQSFTRAVLGRPVFFVDDDPAADRRAQQTLAEIARATGLADIEFQYEPIAAAFDYESQITREELVLVADIGGGTSDFCLVRLSPERAARAERRDDILASGGVHIGGTDFDKYLSLASVMPSLGLGSGLRTGLSVPSAPYFNLATWHTINQIYTRKSAVLITEIRREALMQVEAAKIALSDGLETTLDLDRISAGESLVIHRPDLDTAIGHLVDNIDTTIAKLLRDAGLKADDLDTVFFTGGASGVLLLRERISSLFPKARRVEGDLFGSIGAGLALDAARKFA